MIQENVIEHQVLHHLVFENGLSDNTFTASVTKSPWLKIGLRILHNLVNNPVLTEWSEFYPQSSSERLELEREWNNLENSKIGHGKLKSAHPVGDRSWMSEFLNYCSNGLWSTFVFLEFEDFLQTSWSMKMCNWAITCSTILCLRIVSLSNTFTATLSPVSEFCAYFTFAKEPSPMVRPNSYFPTFLVGITIAVSSSNPTLSSATLAKPPKIGTKRDPTAASDSSKFLRPSWLLNLKSN